MEVNEEHLAFTQEIWNHVYEKNKEYFPDQEVVGWFLSIPGCSMELHEVICRTHLNHFGGSDKVLFVMEPLEKEEVFYHYEEGKMERQTGFYVYYEKNEPMRSFLIAQNERMEKKTEEVDDSAVHTFRQKVERNTEQEKKKEKFPVFRAASVCAMIAVLAVGVLYLNDYQKLKNTEEVIAGLEQQESDPEKVTPVNGQASQKEDPETEGAQAEQSGQTAESSGEDRQEDSQTDTQEEEKSAEDENAGKAEQETQAQTHETYTIVQGDTITRISIKNYGNTNMIDEICQLNHMSEEDLIYPGQKILLP